MDITGFKSVYRIGFVIPSLKTTDNYNPPAAFVCAVNSRKQNPSNNDNWSLMSTADRTIKEKGFEHTYGDTKGAVLSLEDVQLYRSGSLLLDLKEWRLNRKERWALLGPNGCGKSTLLSAIVGTLNESTGGRILIANSKVRIGYLRQTAVDGSTNTVYEEASSGMEDIENAKRRLELSEQRVANGDDDEKSLLDLEKAQQQFEQVGGYTQQGTVERVLKGLGFQVDSGDAERLCSEFSGGWQMRIALAKLLLSEPDLLILDEPSNHLDASARHWLARDYLSNYPHTILLVTHDISLIEASNINNIADISNKYFHTYITTTYSQYKEEKQFRAVAAQTEYEQNLEKAAKLQAYIDRFGASATKASSAQSRLKALERMKKEGKLVPPPTAYTDVADDNAAQQWKPSLVLPEPPKSIGDVLVGVKNANIGYTTTAPNDDNDETTQTSTCLLSNINLEVTRGMKLWLRGPNGAGKSTLLASLRGTLPLLSGERLENDLLQLGVFTQDLAQELDTSKRAIDLVTSYARNGENGDTFISDQTARSVMGRLGLSNEKPLAQVGSLSGGEKARVALSMFALKPSNILLLDEPSNHLDVECIEALSNALQNWGGKHGALVVISHDQAFCESLEFTHVGTVEDGKVVLEQRNARSNDWKIRSLAAGQSSSSTQNEVEELTVEQKEEVKAKRKLVFNAPKRIAKLEQLIEKSELIIASIDDEMMTVGNDVEELMDLTQKREEEQTKVDQMMQEWEELEELIA
eukprot:CAMPEP_0197825904 /NCGR_PEP_ID=MMETSP1437-20131217/2934_1 /TAXON_ID=49252 ORGANISM="Eucampia antarctica, Strain CCMP1452" /NCGR_SAMPLE_ID=MMETSP1437 /ASSEMBLY_ACC=CAM_ASM_001096 /LENGTH=750 /DNA_ID=CAMNT_0043426119 /DNA_START=199 /DNA_END=2452 /DNA_ORIENTATION=+